MKEGRGRRWGIKSIRWSSISMRCIVCMNRIGTFNMSLWDVSIIKCWRNRRKEMRIWIRLKLRSNWMGLKNILLSIIWLMILRSMLWTRIQKGRWEELEIKLRGLNLRKIKLKIFLKIMAKLSSRLFKIRKRL